MSPPRTDTAATWLLAAMALIAVAFAASVSAGSDGVDFYQFWVVGQTVREAPGRDVYADAERARLGAEWLERIERDAGGQPSKLVAVARYRKTLETYSTPFLYSVFGLLASGRWAFDFAAHRIASFAAFALALFGLLRLCRHGLASGLALTTFIVLWYAPFFSEMTVANVNPIQLGLVVAFVAIEAGTPWARRTLAAGAVLGLALAFKPNLLYIPAAVVVAWAVAGRWRSVRDLAAGAAAGVLSGVALSAVVFGGVGAWWRWAEALRRIPDTIISRELGNVAPAMIVRDGLGIEAGWLQGVVVAAAAAAALFTGRRGDSTATGRGDPAALVAVAGFGAALYLLAARLVWAHYLLLALPLVVWSTRPRDLALGETEGFFRARLALGVVALVLVSWNPWSAMLKLPYQAYGIAAWLGMLLLAGVAIATMRSPGFRGALGGGTS